MVRGPSVDKNGLKKGAWSEEEDNKLRAYVLRYGHWNWRQLPRFAGLARCGKSCRLRWMNYLKPGMKRGNFTKDEDEIIIKLHKEIGNKWSVIASELAGRSDNEIKNHWHIHLKKRLRMKSTEQTNTVDYRTSDQVDQSSDEKSGETKMEEDQSAVGTSSSSEVSSSSLNWNYYSADLYSTVTVDENVTSSSHQSMEELSAFEYFWNDDDLTLFAGRSGYSSSELSDEGGFMSLNYSMTDEEEFTLPYSLFGEDDINFLNNFVQ